MAVRMNMSRGQVRYGFNAILIFSLTIACLHLYTLKQRMHQLESRMTVVKQGGDVVRRSLATEDGPDTMLSSNAPHKSKRAVQIRSPLHVKKGSVSSSELIQASEVQQTSISIDNKVLGERLVGKNRSRGQGKKEHFVSKTRRPSQQDRRFLSAEDEVRKILSDVSLAKNATLAQTPAPTEPTVQSSVTTTTAIQKPPTSTPSVHFTTKPPDPIINPHNFSFIINNPDKCGNDNILLLMLVTTTPQGQVQRETIRRTWGNESNIAGVIIKTVFAVGYTGNMDVQKALVEESEKYKDIIQENFVDSYHNLTLKTVMCWKWAFQYCPKAKFIMKADDDTFVNIFSVVKHLIGMQKHAAQKYVAGWVYTDAKPVRDPMSEWNKWYVKYEDFPREWYPKYPCGFAYLISNDITQLLYETSETIKYLFLEDTFLGLCMEKLGIEPVHHGGFCPWYAHIDSCQFEWLMASHWVKRYEDMWYLWNTLTSC